MGRRRGAFAEADIARVIRAAKHAGAAEVEVRIGGKAAIVIRFKATERAPPASPSDDDDGRNIIT